MMMKIKYARRAFVRQRSLNDCGLACLCMVLNYAGLSSKALALRSHGVCAENGSSLSDLKIIAGAYGVDTTCVRLSPEYLRGITRPAILHTMNINGAGHFQVCFGVKQKHGRCFYWMADPARQIYLIAEDELLLIWPTRTALNFADMGTTSVNFTPAWRGLLSLRFFPRAFWIGIPILNACIALFGLALSWVLQRGMTHSLGNYQLSAEISLIILLFMVMMFKVGLSYVKDIVLISLNKTMNINLAGNYIKYLSVVCHGSGKPCDRDFIQLGFSEIQKIQQAISVFLATLLADGALVVIALGSLVCLSPAVAAIDAGNVMVVIALTLHGLPKAAFQRAHLHQLSGSVMEKPALNHARFLDFSEILALHGLRRRSLVDSLGAFSISAAFAFSLVEMRQGKFDYTTFLLLIILSYIIASLLPKIANALSELNDGAEAFRQHSFRVQRD